MDGTPARMDAETAVRTRYEAAAKQRESALCCPVSYDPRWLERIPQEIRDKDYGCGDPSAYVREGDVVLDLGSGGGKICFIAAQVVGVAGRVIGVDVNDDMLALARRAAPEVAARLGFANVEFHRGRIEDLRLDLDRVQSWLRANPVRDLDGLRALDAETERLRANEPMIADGSIDVVVSNCVLNLVRESEKAKLIREIYRVLRRGGRIALSDIVSDEPVPAELKADPELWSGCISGAFEEQALLRELEEAGFYGITIAKREETPFAVVDGIEFRSVTVTARKGLEGPCLEANQAVIYRGPWKRVEDDDGHVLVRGERAAVCAKTYDVLTGEPYAREVIPVPPRVAIAADERAPFDCARTAPRHPRETKGAAFHDTVAPGACAPNGGCC